MRILREGDKQFKDVQGLSSTVQVYCFHSLQHYSCSHTGFQNGVIAIPNHIKLSKNERNRILDL